MLTTLLVALSALVSTYSAPPELIRGSEYYFVQISCGSLAPIRWISDVVVADNAEKNRVVEQAVSVWKLQAASWARGCPYATALAHRFLSRGDAEIKRRQMLTNEDLGVWSPIKTESFSFDYIPN